MKTESFWWLAGVIAAHKGRRVQGRTRLQKTVKLLQRLGMPTDYLYSIFFYGPYSEGVQAEIGVLQRLGLVVEAEQTGPEGAGFVIEATPEADLPEIEAFRPALKLMENADAVVLELAATYDAFREMGSDHAEALARLRHKKKAKCNPEREEKAFELLRRLGLLTDG